MLAAVLGASPPWRSACSPRCPASAVTVVLLFVLLGLLGMGNGAVFQLVGVRLPERVGADDRAVGAAGGVGGFLLPFGFGWLMRSDAAASPPAFAVLAACVGRWRPWPSSAATASWVRRARPGRMEAAA